MQATMAATKQRKLIEDLAFDKGQVEDFINDQRLLALANIKVMSNETREEEEAEQQEELKEMVAFLLNQDQDTDQVQHVARRLLSKVYTQEYNEFVQDKN